MEKEYQQITSIRWTRHWARNLFSTGIWSSPPSPLPPPLSTTLPLPSVSSYQQPLPFHLFHLAHTGADAGVNRLVFDLLARLALGQCLQPRVCCNAYQIAQSQLSGHLKAFNCAIWVGDKTSGGYADSLLSVESCTLPSQTCNNTGILMMRTIGPSCFRIKHIQPFEEEKPKYEFFFSWFTISCFPFSVTPKQSLQWRQTNKNNTHNAMFTWKGNKK